MNMQSKLGGVYAVDLLSINPMAIDLDKLLTHLRQNCGRVEVMTGNQTTGQYLFAFLDYTVEYSDGKAPAQAMLHLHGIAPNIDTFMPAVQQSWGWQDAHEIVTRCCHSALLTDLLARGLSHKRRLQLFHNVLRAILVVATCDAIHWQASQQFVMPTAYLEAQKSGQLLYGALNVRFFNIQNREPGETLMDTMGLAIFGLPDVQCHFSKLDLNEVARILYNTGSYLFEQGDIIKDGETVAGIRPADRWECRHEDALAEPARVVLDINPGGNYAAGNRS